MRNSLKIARWEIHRNIKQRSFWLSIVLTPLIFGLFFFVPVIIDMLTGTPKPFTIYVRDDLAIWSTAESELLSQDGSWNVILVSGEQEQEILEQLKYAEKTLYLPLSEQVLEDGRVLIYSSDDVDPRAVAALHFLDNRLDAERLRRMGITGPEAEWLLADTEFELVPLSEQDGEPALTPGQDNPERQMRRMIPAIFAGVILLSVIITGMMIFQSATQEKKEKLSEMLLSSVTPGELMQGKILGYFSLGILQVSVWLALIIPIVYWRWDFPFLRYLFVPELAPLLFYAVAGYLLYASLFVAMGATVEDMSSASNFQGMVFLLPWLPLMFIIPILNDPAGTVAAIASYFPFSTPGVMIIRLALLDDWPWLDIAGTSLVLLISIWLTMKLAGKIFKVGMLLYGKNASPQEIWRWLRY